MAKKQQKLEAASVDHFVVATGISYTAGGISYGPGDRIPAKIFGDPEFLKNEITAGKLLSLPEQDETAELDTDTAGDTGTEGAGGSGTEGAGGTEGAQE